MCTLVIEFSHYFLLFEKLKQLVFSIVNCSCDALLLVYYSVLVVS